MEQPSSSTKKGKSLIGHYDVSRTTTSPSKKRRSKWQTPPLNSNSLSVTGSDNVIDLTSSSPTDQKETTTSPSKKRRPNWETPPLNSLSVTGSDNVIDLTNSWPTDQKEADAALARSLGGWPREVAGDAEFARALDAQLRQEEKRAKGAAELAMLKTTTGKAWKFVEGVLAVHENLSKDIPSNASPRFIEPIAVDDMVALTERLIEKQEEFQAAGKPCLVDLGYHWTTEANLQSIQTGGLLTKQERDSSNIKAKNNGSAYGDGIYTTAGPSHTWNQRYGNIGLMVARLNGQTGPENHKNDAVDTVVPRSMATWAVLRSSSQCVALMQFKGTELNFDGPNCPSVILVKPYHKALQRLINELFNVGAGSVPEEPQCASGWLKPPTAQVPVIPSGVHAPARQVVPTNRAQSLATVATARQVVPANRAQSLATAGKRALAASKASTQAAAANAVLQPIFYQSPNNPTDQNVLRLPLECYASKCYDANSCCALCSDSQKRARLIRLKACRHEIHEKCLRLSTKKKRPLCPVCKKIFAPPFGMMPTGVMSISLVPQRCFGYSVPSLMITYAFGSGIQKTFHPNPGKPYTGTTLQAYLPDDVDGRRLLGRLREAFNCGLTVDVRNGAIVWGSIPHKTFLSGGAQNNGFPDGQFFQNCNSALDALRVNQAI